MLDKNPLLALFLALCVGICIGFGIGYSSKPIPEPVISVKPLMKAPWLEITVNGKAVDLTKLKFGPEEKKRWWGDEAPAAWADHQGWIPITYVQNQPVANNRGGGGAEWLGLEKVIDKLIAWLSDKSKDTEAALVRREIALSKGWESLKTMAVVFVAVVIIPMLWIGWSLQRIADKSG